MKIDSCPGNGQAQLFASPPQMVAGVDEVGRGPLAGPVVAGAVILDPHRPVDGLADSKTLSVNRRQQLALEIQQCAIAWSVAWADSAEIDSLNILQASLLAMRRAVFGLWVAPSFLCVDGNRLPHMQFYGAQIDGDAIVGGDGSHAAISAASIVAKVHRDQMMVKLDAIYPAYGFSRHKGYGTEAHRESLDRVGPCPEHRRSFRPVAIALANQMTNNI
jgi:ribonuclease HII